MIDTDGKPLYQQKNKFNIVHKKIIPNTSDTGKDKKKKKNSSNSLFENNEKLLIRVIK